MKIVDANYQILTKKTAKTMYKDLEKVARTCYKSEDHIKADGSSAESLIGALVKNGHTAILDHETIRVKFIVDRGVSHEIVRHRMAAYAQESTRYCNYSKDKFGNEITVVRPFFFENSARYDIWKDACESSEKAYFELLKTGASPQEARSVLPNSLKTEIVMTADITEWRHFFKVRCSPAAHPQIREVALPLLKDLAERYPLLFADILATISGRYENA